MREDQLLTFTVLNIPNHDLHSFSFWMNTISSLQSHPIFPPEYHPPATANCPSFFSLSVFFTRSRQSNTKV